MAITKDRCETCISHCIPPLCSNTTRAEDLFPGRTYFETTPEGHCVYWCPAPAARECPGSRPGFRMPSSGSREAEGELEHEGITPSEGVDHIEESEGGDVRSADDD